MTSMEKKLDQSFDELEQEEIMVPAVFLQKMEETLENLPPKETGNGVDLPKKKKRKWWVYAASVASFLVAGFVTTYSISADFKEYVKNLFPVNDSGYQKAQQEGLVESLQLTATDKGYTIEIKELLVEGRRVSVVYEIKNEKGESVPYSALFSAVNTQWHAYIVDPQTKKEKEIWINDIQNANNRKGIGTGLLTLESPTEIPDKAVFKLEVNHLWKEGNYVSPKIADIDVRGTWNFSIPIDLTKAKAKQKTGMGSERIQLSTGEFFVESLELLTSQTVLKTTFVGEGGESPETREMAEYQLLDDKGNLLFSNENWHILQKYHNNDFLKSRVGGMHIDKKYVDTYEFAIFPPSSYFTYRLHALWIKQMLDQKVLYQPNTHFQTEAGNFTVGSLQKGKHGTKELVLQGEIKDGYGDMKFHFYDQNGKLTGYAEVMPMQLLHGNGKAVISTSIPNNDTKTTTIMLDSIAKRIPINKDIKIVPQPAK
ncbi:DUF4179 domain-containing protein [Risungbinella massiliensis]|uniref:DUF4179 domain-containing protein n=1 Tax=Risungbinella massiliensis TaxID=1329796 RepID=UPI0005CC350D|nr:DUF4179 domain-containing protein [Risungbinella massiliensis]